MEQRGNGNDDRVSKDADYHQDGFGGQCDRVEHSRRPGWLLVLQRVKNFVYTIDVSEHLLRGESVTDEQIQAWADEAEAGYDLASLPKARRGRPPVGDGPGVVVPVRLDAATLAALTARAEAEGIQHRSEAIRAAVKAWVDVA